jgi:hypothetical protein
MKISAFLILIVAVGLVLTAGCIAQTKKEVNTTTVAVTNTFTPFVNTTTIPVVNTSVNATNTTNVTPKLKGPLRVSIGSYSTDDPLPVIIDNKTVGNVKAGFPLDLMVNEGNHSVSVCVGLICPEKYVTVVFAKSSYLDFEDALRAQAEFSKPVVRILRSFKSGSGVGVELEFINPTQKALTMSAEVSVGYTYIDGRTNIRMGDSVRAKASEFMDPGRRTTRIVDLFFADGSAYSYDEPAISQVTYQ